jgi:hypothetical protein
VLPMFTVRITAFPVRWLSTPRTFADSKVIIWSTGQRTQPGDVQVFAVSATLGRWRWFKNDPRRDAVHSIWRATTPPREEYGSGNWPIQAQFKLLLKLKNPVPKGDLIRAGLLKQTWPRSSAGKVLSRCSEITKLAQVLAARNRAQREEIFAALCV